MGASRFLLPAIAPLVAVTLWACITDPGTGTGGSGGASSTSSTGAGGSGGTTTVTGGGGTGPTVRCTLDNGTDPVVLCTQKLVLQGQHQAAFDETRGVAQSWDSTTLIPDQDGSHAVLHDPLDDAAFSAAVARYAASAQVYGDTEITVTLTDDLILLEPKLVAELTPPPAGYAGELYLDLRAAAGGLRLANRNDLGDAVDAVAETYGRAIFDTYFTPLGGDAGPPDGVLGTPATGGAVAYAPGDVASAALALADLAVRHAKSEPAHAAAWQDAAARAFAHLDARARDAKTGLYPAALVTSADPGGDALAAPSPGGLPADALLTDVTARVALSLLRAEELASANPTVLPALAAAPLGLRAEALLKALDATPSPLWDNALGGYYAGFVPSTAEVLTDKPTRANAFLLGALHRAAIMGNGPDAARLKPLKAVVADRTHTNASLVTVLNNQSSYLRGVPWSFQIAGADAGSDPRYKSYFSSANAAAIEGLTELWVGVPH